MRGNATALSINSLHNAGMVNLTDFNSQYNGISAKVKVIPLGAVILPQLGGGWRSMPLL
jgi:hypothetical protein